MTKEERKALTRVCAYCEHAKTIWDEKTMLCSRKGIVSREYCCRAFAYDPLKRKPEAPRALEIPPEEEMHI